MTAATDSDLTNISSYGRFCVAQMKQCGAGLLLREKLINVLLAQFPVTRPDHDLLKAQNDLAVEIKCEEKAAESAGAVFSLDPYSRHDANAARWIVGCISRCRVPADVGIDIVDKMLPALRAHDRERSHTIIGDLYQHFLDQGKSWHAEYLKGAAGTVAAGRVFSTPDRFTYG